MRNFYRVLKLSSAYWRQLSLSVICALAVALTWSLNLSAVYPVMKILGKDTNLQTWIDREIDDLGTLASDPTRNLRLADLDREILKLKNDPASAERDVSGKQTNACAGPGSAAFSPSIMWA